MGRPKKNKELLIIEEKPMTDLKELDSIQTEVDLARKELEKIKLDIEEGKSSVKKMASREVSEDEMVIIKKDVNVSVEQKAMKQKIAQQKLFDSTPIKGKFLNRRAPGQPAKLTYMKYADDPVKWYPFEDGGVYTIPRGFVEQINEHYYTPKFIQKQGESHLAEGIVGVNSSISDVDTSNKKYAFIPLNF